MASAVKSNPRYDYRVKALNNTECTLEYFQDGEAIGVSSFTMDDAKSAGISGKDNWKKYPRNMLFARAMSNGVRLYCPDVFRGNAVYTEGEIDADEWHVVEPEPMPEPPPTNGKPPVEPPPAEHDDNPFVEEPVTQVVGTELNAFQKWARGENGKNGPASMSQYGYLIGVIDTITGQKTHKEVLSKLLGMKISSDNVPSATLASGLLDGLIETKKDDDGNEYHNDKYKPKAVACIKQLGEMVMADAGQQKLIVEEAA